MPNSPDPLAPGLPVKSKSTFIDILRWRAQHQPERLAYTYLADGEMTEAEMTYRDLDRHARQVAAQLQSLDVEGERVLLLCPPGFEYIGAFFGCLYAGAIAIPVYPPRLNRNLLRLQAIAADAQAKVALTTSTVLSRIRPLLGRAVELEKLVWLATDVREGGTEDDWREPSLNGDTIAFLQYTSGSTGIPKGVILTHRNLLHNSALLEHAFGYSPESRCVTWLPMYHDMGLIGGIIQPLYGGFACTLMSPTSFLQRPVRWLQAITRFQGTISGGPNFAYDLCVRKIKPDERAELNLSSWNVAFNGSEPIRYDTLERFATAFGPCGFRREAFHPCYGLAEATLIVTGSKTSALPIRKLVQTTALEHNHVVQATDGDAGARSITSCGGLLPEQKVLIVHPESLKRCRPDEVGEIWVQGPSVALGYWNRVQENEDTFHTSLAQADEGGFLRTGDLGFVNEDHLFVTGRLKDLIIIRGLNHYPQDIELTVERSHPALRPGCGAAFSIEENGEERLVVVHELGQPRPSRPGEVFENIRQAVAEDHELQVHAILLLKPGSIPKTSSGKLQRHACRVAFLAGSLAGIGAWQAPQTSESEAQTLPLDLPLDTFVIEAIEHRLVSHLAGKLGVQASQIDVRQPIISYGLDSLMAIELMHDLQSAFGIRLPLTSFFESQSISELAAQALACRPQTASVRATQPGAAARLPIMEQPCSYGQESLWFMSQLAPESAAYNISACVRICSELYVATLRNAFQMQVDRHQCLRATFVTVDGEPRLRVHDQMEVSFEQHDASGWSEAQLQTRLVAESHTPFNLEQGPLLRVCLFMRPQPQDVHLLLIAHHSIIDLWSLAVLMYELGQAYQAEKDGTRIHLPPLKIQYTDYIRWERETIAGPEGERLWKYWRQQLTGELPLLNLPTDYPRPATQTFKGASSPLTISAELTGNLKALARERGATLYMILLAAYQALLYRYTGQEDLIVGSPTSNRNRAEVSDIVGFFTNMLSLRCRLAPNLSFTDLLEQTRRTTLDAFAHQEYPFPLLVKRLHPERDASRQPIFQTMFILHKTHLLNEEGLGAFALGESGARMKLGQLLLESVALEQRVAPFDLSLLTAEVEGHLTASFEYLTDLFDVTTISRIAGHYQILLAGIVANPEQRLAELPLLSKAEQQMLADWNETEREYPDEVCIHELFERQATRTPEGIALVCNEERLTYRELNCRANQLAHYLRGAGVGPDVLVGILMERSVELLVGLLGVLKAGGAYVPLDPQYPAERLSFMFEDAEIAVLITQEDLRDRIAGIAVRQIIIAEQQSWRDESTKNPSAAVTAANLAYVIYTSGSTGRPKAVAIEHHSAATLLYWAREKFSPAELQGVLASTSICFDLSVFELFVPLSWGGTVILAENALALPNLPAKTEVRLINTVPSAIAELVRMRAIPDQVHVVNLAGEALRRELVTELYGQQNIERVLNLYGPSEDTTYSTYAELQRGEEGRVVIGRPIAKTRAYVVDDRGAVAPIGVAGELCLGGEGLARGYLKRADLTAEKFIPDGLSGQTGARLYRTGDLTRYLADRNIEYLGRSDHQVKIRGFRIEPGEIEAVLSEHPAIREGVVLAREDLPGQKRLVSYLVLHEGHSPTISELRQFLKQKLPDYMVPSAFIILPQFPVTSNGKLDRRALPIPESERPDLGAVYQAPRDAVEAELARIWAEALGLERVGIHDNFFELGGDSILSIRIISRAAQAGLQLSPRLLFQHQTIAELAAVAASAAPAAAFATQSLVTGAVPQTPIQQWFLSQNLAAPHHWNQSLLLVSKHGLEVEHLRRVIEQVQRHHDALRLRFTLRAGGRWEQHNRGAEVCDEAPLLVVDLSEVDSSAQQSAVLEEVTRQAQASLELEGGPVCRVVLFECGAGRRQRLLVIAHQLVMDAGSWRILLEDLARGYEQCQRGDGVSFGAKTMSYQQWAEELAEYARSAEVEQQLGYWMRRCEQAAAAGGLPVADKVNDAAVGAGDELGGRQNLVRDEQTVSVELGVAETSALLREVGEAYRAQIEEVLLCAVLEACRRWSGERVQVVEVEGHGREKISSRVDVTRTVGWFTTKYPVVVELSESGAVVESLKRVKEELRGVPMRGLGYGLLRYLSERAAVREGLKLGEVWQMSFNYLGQLDAAGAEVEQFEIERQSGAEERAGENARPQELHVRAFVMEGRLGVEWMTSRRQYAAATIKRVAEEFLGVLRELIEKSGTMDGFTPSDFPWANISQHELEKFLLKIN